MGVRGLPYAQDIVEFQVSVGVSMGGAMGVAIHSEFPNGRRPTYLRKHGRTGWKYDRTKPADVREALGGASHWIRSFGGLSYQEAVATARVLAVEHDRQIAQMRKLAPEERTKFVAAGGLEKLRLDAETSERHAEHMQRLADSVQDDPLAVGLPYGISRDQMAGSFLSARRQAGIFTRIARKKRQLVAKVDKTPSGNFIATIIPVWERHAPRPPH